MSQPYCTPIDLIGYANKARLLSQIASADYGAVPTADEVMNYFVYGTVTNGNEESLALLQSRVEQVIINAASEIDGYLALAPTVQLPAAMLATANMDMAMARLFETLADDSQVKINANRWSAFLDKLITGKVSFNTAPDPAPISDTGAAIMGSDVFFNEDTFDGY